MSANQTNALRELKFDAQTRKRATWEAFEFAVPIEGTVVVTNGSYGAEAGEHTYAVNVKDGVPTDCVCSADQFQDGACKHRVAVAINAPVLSAASASGPDGKRALADGGMVSEAKPPESEPETHHAPGCSNPECEGIDADADRPLLSFECWDQWAAYSSEASR